MFSIVRVSSDYEVVVLQTGSGLDARYYCYHRGQDGCTYEKEVEADAGRAEAVFTEITEREAMLYTCGQADGMGFGDGPDRSLTTLQEAWTWIRSKQAVLDEARLARDIADDKPRLIDLMMKAAPVTKEKFKELLRKHGDIARWPEFEKRYEGKFKP